MTEDRGRRPLTMTHWGTYEASVEDGCLTRLSPFSADTDPSGVGAFDPAVLTAPSRIRAPMVREGFLSGKPRTECRRGEDRFVTVTWSEATALVASELCRVRDTHGNAAIFGGSYGWASAGRFHHAQSQIHRFLNCVGGYTGAVNTYSYAAAEVLLPHVCGDTSGLEYGHTSWPVIAENTQLFVAFGGIPLKNAQIAPGGMGVHHTRAGLTLCRDAGVEFVNISPIASDSAAFLSARQLAIRPGSDTALMLALCFVLVSEGRHDEAFLASHTVGFEHVRAYLYGEVDGVAKTPDWAAPLTDIPADAIRALAREMAARRTMISVAWSLQRADRGEQPYWAAITLAAILGQVGLPGGGIGFGYGATNQVGAGGRPFKWGSLPQLRNPVQTRIPVARIADALLNPGAEIDYNGEKLRLPEIRLIYWAGGNPFHHHQDLTRLDDAWQHPDTVVVHEIWWTATARRADIVLPVASPFERNDIGCARGEDHIVAMRKLIEPVGEARSDFEIFSEIAEKMQMRELFRGGRDEMDWLRAIFEESRDNGRAQGIDFPDFDTFWEGEGVFELPRPEVEPVLWRDFREDPIANPLATPSGRLELYSERIAGFAYADCAGHAKWYEPDEWLGSDLVDVYPLHLLSNQPETRLHSQLDNASVSAASKVAGREPVWINPVDAESRGIAAGDVVRVFNDRGSCLAGAIVTGDIRPSVVRLATGAWYDPEGPGNARRMDRHGNVNVLTRDAGTSRLAQGPVAESLLVEIERYKGEPTPVRAFEPPPIVEMAAKANAQIT
ncbi:molybdopterin-dependent oxidoreductase [Microbaculum sp. FT89]|uniref:molybdopterin-dependent oxidoreductase n=1 Tax=Microbaculum sp. FT89 TaxID=3447298 RepID=UPI003F53A1CA